MPRLAGRRRSLIGGLLLLAAVLPAQAFAQAPAQPGTPAQPGVPVQPGTPAEPPAPAPIPAPRAVVPEPQPIPVIPDAQLIPSSNVPSVPLRVLPAPVAGVSPTARFQLSPSIAVTEEYTDNFDLTEHNKRSNFRSTVAPGLGLTINSAFVKGLIAYKFAPAYDTATQEISLFHSAAGQVVWEATPLWKLTLADTFTRSDEPTEADRLALRQQRQTFTSNTLFLASDYLLSTIATRQSYQMATFSDADGRETKSHTLALSATAPLYVTNSISGGYEYLTSSTTGGTTGSTLNGTTTTLGGVNDFDVTGHKFTASLSRQVNTLRTVGIITSYALRTVTTTTGGDADFQIWNASVFMDYVLPGRLKLNTTLGLSGLTTDSGQSLGPNLTTKTSLSYQFARTVVSLAADRGFSETFSEGQDFGVVETEGVTASLTYAFTPSLSAMASGSYRHNKTTGIGNGNGATTTTATTLNGSGNEDTTNWGGTVSLTWRILRGLLLDVSYTYTRQLGSDTNQVGTTNTGNGSFGTGNNYTENRVRASLSLTF